MIIEVPVFNEDGSLNFTAKVSEKEAQMLLQFALNLSVVAGLISVSRHQSDEGEETNLVFPQTPSSVQ
jgi:hypothetical protein